MKMEKQVRIKAAHIVIGICLLAAGILAGHLVMHLFSVFGGISGNGTVLSFDITEPAGMGFDRNVTVYTEDGTTNVIFSGKITVDGTAEIVVTANEDGRVIYHVSYSDATEKPLHFEVDGLAPNAYYTLHFSSEDAKKGHLILETNQSLVERPERPDHSIPMRIN